MHLGTGLSAGMKGVESSVQVTSEIALEAPTNLSRSLALRRSPVNVLLGAGIVGHPDYDGHMQCTIETTIATTVEPMSDSVSRRRWDGIDSGKGSERSLGTHSPRMRPDGVDDCSIDRSDPGLFQ